jgi:small basic protein (TIGR04137 family)
VNGSIKKSLKTVEFVSTELGESHDAGQEPESPSRALLRLANVLTRAERLKRLQELDKWKEGDALVGMPKVRVVKVSLKKKKKVKTEEADDKKKKKK